MSGPDENCTLEAPGPESSAHRPVDLQHLTIRVLHRADEISGRRVIGVDLAVSEISDERFQRFAREFSKAGRCTGKTPRVVEVAVRDQTGLKVAVQIELIDIALRLFCA